MKRLIFLVLLTVSIVCITVTAFTAQMEYGFAFQVGDSGMWAGTPLGSNTEIEVVLYGDTDDVENDQYLPVLAGELSVDGFGTFELLGDWELSFGRFNEWYIGYDSVAASRVDVAQNLLGVRFPANFEYGPSDVFEFGIQPSPYSGVGGLFATSGGELTYTGTHGWDVSTYRQTSVPIPSAMLLLSSGLTILIGFRRKLPSQL